MYYNISYRFYVPIKIIDGIPSYIYDSSGKIRMYTTREKLVKNVKDYDKIYCYDLINKL